MQLPELSSGNYALSKGSYLSIREKYRTRERFVRHFEGWSEVVFSVLHDKPATTTVFFMLLCGNIKPMNGSKVYIDKRAYMEKYSFSQTQLYRWLSDLTKGNLIRLVHKGIKLIDQGYDTPPLYVINPHLVWSGKDSDRELAIAEWDNSENRSLVSML